MLQVPGVTAADDMRTVRHGQDIGHLGFGRGIDNGDLYLVADGVQHLGDENAAVEDNRLPWLQVNCDVAVSLPETVDCFAEQVEIVVAAGDMVPAAEVDPLHLREIFPETLLEAFEHPHQNIRPLFAERVKMESGDAAQINAFKIFRSHAESRAGQAGVV